MSQPGRRIEGILYGLIKGRERGAFAFLRRFQGALILIMGPLLSSFIGGIDLRKPTAGDLSGNIEAEKSFQATAHKRFIEDQKTPGCRSMKVGVTDIGFAGCGIVAAYNLLVALGDPVPLSQLIEHFEYGSLLLKGGFGTDPFRIAAFFHDRGYVTRSLRPDDTSKADYLLLAFWNDRDDIEKSAHTVAMDREGDGRLHSHNDGDTMAFTDVRDFFRHHPEADPIMVVSIDR